MRPVLGELEARRARGRGALSDLKMEDGNSEWRLQSLSPMISILVLLLGRKL